MLRPRRACARSPRSPRHSYMETSDSYARTADRAAAETFGARIATHAAASAKESTVAFGHQVQRSNLLLNGVLLLVAGFLGLWSAFSLQLQDAIISIYVFLFGALLIFFKLGINKEVMQTYFGFIHSGTGQLLMLVVAGNLAWFTGWVGIVVAIFTNINGALTWYNARTETVEPS